MITSLKKYRYDCRGIAFYFLIKSYKKNFLIVEGKDDKEIYGLLLKKSSIYVKTTEIDENSKSSNKDQVLKIREIINKISSQNKKIAFLIDRDTEYKQKEDNNLFITDFYSIENYPIVLDKKNIHFKNLESLKKNKISLMRKFINYFSNNNEKNLNYKKYNSWDAIKYNFEKEPDNLQISNEEILKKFKGKILFKTLKKNKNKKLLNYFLSEDINFKDIKVLSRIILYFKE